MRSEWFFKEISSMTPAFLSSKWRKRTFNCWGSSKSASSDRMSFSRRMLNARLIEEWRLFWNNNMLRNSQTILMNFREYLKCWPRKSTCTWAWANKSPKIARKEGAFLKTWCQQASKIQSNMNKTLKDQQTQVTLDTAKKNFRSWDAVTMSTRSRTISLNSCTINGEED